MKALSEPDPKRASGDERLHEVLDLAETVVVASGVSCRQQIFHGTERTAWHPVQLLREALDVDVS
ncbi:hypothetical protein [Streptomyces niger]|uniref:hypothetical protein n=1 Tax=Streptomyces niger TaxID=66373 RepID=UPI00069A0F8E|nr:hypothetical protein [Streptomyces niger]